MDFRLYGVNETKNTLQELIGIFRFSQDSDVHRLISEINSDSYRYARRIVHKDTRSLFNSITKTEETWRGELFLDPSVRNPKSKTPPSEYGFYENRRGGSHNFMDRTYDYSQANFSRKLGELYK